MLTVNSKGIYNRVCHNSLFLSICPPKLGLYVYICQDGLGIFSEYLKVTPGSAIRFRIYKGIWSKIQRKIWHFSFLHVFHYFFGSKGSVPHSSICLIDTVLLIPILAYFMTFLCHIAYVIKRHKMAFYDVLNWVMG